jgi:hypothetical protein
MYRNKNIDRASGCSLGLLFAIPLGIALLLAAVIVEFYPRDMPAVAIAEESTSAATLESLTPTQVPTGTPTETPTGTPTETPTETPTGTPTETPTETPTGTPTETPTETPTGTPTETPTETPTSTPTQAAPVVLTVTNVVASTYAPPSFDACGNPASYEPFMAIDGQPDTAWRIAGNGVGAWIEVNLGAPTTVTQFGLIAGYNKIDPCDGADRFLQNHTVRRVRLDFVEAGQSLETTLGALRDMQYVDVPDVQTQRVRMTILESAPPLQQGFDTTAVSEIQVWGRHSNGHED